MAQKTPDTAHAATAKEAKRTSRATPGRDKSAGKRKPALCDPSVRSTNPGGVEVLAAANLSGCRWLVHGFSTRQQGVSSAYGGRALNLGPTREDSPENLNRNRELFITQLGALDANARPWPLVTVKQIHSAIIHRIHQPPNRTLSGDGLITSEPGILLGIKTADCLPVLIADPERRAIGAFHAGWRGTARRIVEKGVGEMRKHFGSDPREVARRHRSRHRRLLL